MTRFAKLMHDRRIIEYTKLRTILSMITAVEKTITPIPGSANRLRTSKFLKKLVQKLWKLEREVVTEIYKLEKRVIKSDWWEY